MHDIIHRTVFRLDSKTSLKNISTKKVVCSFDIFQTYKMSKKDTGCMFLPQNWNNKISIRGHFIVHTELI